LKELVGQFVIDEISGEVHAVKPDFEVVDELKILILTIVTQKVVLENLHFLFLLRDHFLEKPRVRLLGFYPVFTVFTILF
jgi:hypothetical protein